MEATGTHAAPGCHAPAAWRWPGARAVVPRAVRPSVWRRRLAIWVLPVALSLAMRPSVGALDWVRLQQAAVALGPRAERSANDLRELMGRLGNADDATRLERVNAFVNRRVAFVPDSVVWNQADYWASPLETLGKGEGDCEDYAIAKYYLLVASGIPAARLRLVYVRAVLPAQPGQPAGAQAHMVLAYYADPGAEPMILDNLVTEIRPASRRPDLTPVFSFNSEGLWNGAGAQPAGDPQARLSRWREVMQKARGEGFE